MLDQKAMSETLKEPLVRWLKNQHGEMRRVSTNGKVLATKWQARTDKPDQHGLILRMTKEQAEKDPTP
jgi:hypothetical protein